MAQKEYLAIYNVIPSHTLMVLASEWNGMCEQ